MKLLYESKEERKVYGRYGEGKGQRLWAVGGHRMVND